MLKKHSFPDNWSNLTYEQVSKSIKYLLKNYKRYKISVSDDKTVHIGNVNLSDVFETKFLGFQYTCIRVNERLITMTGDNLHVFDDMLRLREMAEYQMLPPKQRVKEWCAYNPGWVVSGVVAAFTALLVFGTMTSRIERDNGEKTQPKQETFDTVKTHNNDTINYYNQNQR